MEQLFSSLTFLLSRLLRLNTREILDVDVVDVFVVEWRCQVEAIEIGDTVET